MLRYIIGFRDVVVSEAVIDCDGVVADYNLIDERLHEGARLRSRMSGPSNCSHMAERTGEAASGIATRGAGLGLRYLLSLRGPGGLLPAASAELG